MGVAGAGCFRSLPLPHFLTGRWGPASGRSNASPIATIHLRVPSTPAMKLTVNFAGTASPGALVHVEIDSATSTTLKGTQLAAVAA